MSAYPYTHRPTPNYYGKIGNPTNRNAPAISWWSYPYTTGPTSPEYSLGLSGLKTNPISSYFSMYLDIVYKSEFNADITSRFYKIASPGAVLTTWSATNGVNNSQKGTLNGYDWYNVVFKSINTKNPRATFYHNVFTSGYAGFDLRIDDAVSKASVSDICTVYQNIVFEGSVNYQNQFTWIGTDAAGVKKYFYRSRDEIVQMLNSTFSSDVSTFIAKVKLLNAKLDAVVTPVKTRVGTLESKVADKRQSYLNEKANLEAEIADMESLILEYQNELDLLDPIVDNFMEDREIVADSLYALNGMVLESSAVLGNLSVVSKPVTLVQPTTLSSAMLSTLGIPI